MTKELFLYGLHAVEEALHNPNRCVLEVLTCGNTPVKIEGAMKKVPLKKVALKKVPRGQLEKLLPQGAVHQGIVARVRPLEQPSLEEVLTALDKQANAQVLLLDQVTDPHNVGALLRSALGFYASALIVPDAHCPEESATLAKTASGALEHVPLVRVSNLARAMEILKQHKFWCIGLAGGSQTNLATLKLPPKTAFVLGAEGQGLRPLTIKNCDYVGFIPMNPELESFNVSNAGAVMMYEWIKQHPK